MIGFSRLIELLVRFRTFCFELFPEDVDLVANEERSKRLGLATRNDLYSQLNTSRHKPAEEACRLVKTPRLLKLIFRKTYRMWQHLHGEIDFDDMLVANVLHFAAPEAFDFLIENINEIRGLTYEGVLNDIEKRRESVESKWERVAQNANWDTTSAKCLMTFLFPCWQGSRQQNLQGVQVAAPTDYWTRYLMEDLSPSEPRDQEVLSIIKEWIDNAVTSALVNSLCTNPEFTSKFEHFASLALNGDALRKLAGEVFFEAIRNQGVTANNESVPGFIPLWRCAIRQPVEESDHLRWVEEEVCQALPKSLRFANDLYYYWRSNKEFDIREEGHRVGLRNNIISCAKRLFANDPRLLLKILDPGYMYSAYHFCVTFSSAKEGGAGFSADEWQWFAKVIIDAGEIDGNVMIPQICCFVVEENSKIRDFTYSFKMDFAEDFFRGLIHKLMRILSRDIPVDRFNPREKNRIETARIFALDWMTIDQHRSAQLD